MMTGAVRSFGRGGRSLKKGRERLRIDESLGRLERMKIGVGDADVPGDQTMRTDLDPFFGHDERAVHQSEIADRAASRLRRWRTSNRRNRKHDRRARLLPALLCA